MLGTWNGSGTIWKSLGWYRDEFSDQGGELDVDFGH